MGRYKRKHGYSRFAHWIGLNGQDVGDWLNRGVDKLGSFLSGAFDRFTQGGSELSNQFSSFVNQLTGAHATGMMQEQNQMQMQNIEDQYQRQVQGMQSSGLNPALMYQNGSSSSAPSAPSNSAGASMSDILSMMSLPLQLRDLKASAKLKDSESDVNEAQARSIGINTDFNEQTFELRKEALNLSNNLSRAQVGKINQDKQESIARMHQAVESALTEASKRAVNEAQALLYRTEAQDIVALQPYKIQFTQAQTSAQKASAALSAAQEAYQRGLVDSGYIDKLCSELEARAAQYGAEAQVREITANIKSGNVISPVELGDSKFANFLEGVWNGMVTESVNNGLAVIANLLDYMPPVLLTPKSPTDAFVDSSTSTYGVNGQLKSTSVSHTHSYK